jgi:hypothetical protein
VADIVSSQVVTTDVYTYIGVIVEVLNEGLPRTAWNIIGDRSTPSVKSRISFAYTLVVTQIILGALLTVVFVGSAEKLAGAFVPAQVRKTSLTYVRISSVQALSSVWKLRFPVRHERWIIQMVLFSSARPNLWSILF